MVGSLSIPAFEVRDQETEAAEPKDVKCCSDFSKCKWMVYTDINQHSSCFTTSVYSISMDTTLNGIQMCIYLSPLVVVSMMKLQDKEHAHTKQIFVTKIFWPFNIL